MTTTDEAKLYVIQISDLWKIAVILTLLFVVSMAMLLMFCEKGYRHTFFQTTRSWQYNKALFDTGDDEYRMSIFDDHRAYYSWYEGEVKEWLGEVR